MPDTVWRSDSVARFKWTLPVFSAGAANLACTVGQPRLQYPDSLYGAAVCAYRRRRHAVLGFTARAVWPGGGLLRDKHAGGLFSGQLEFTPGSR